MKQDGSIINKSVSLALAIDLWVKRNPLGFLLAENADPNSGYQYEQNCKSAAWKTF